MSDPRSEPSAPRPAPGSSAAPSDEGGADVLTLVCETCGKDYFFADERPPAALACEKCGSTVFRAFHEPSGDAAADDFRETTARDLDPDDPEGDTLPGDVLDLDTV